MTGNFAEDLKNEIAKARSKHTPQPTSHGAYAVILEELDEVWEIVKADVPDASKLYKELVQVACTAQRMAEETLPLVKANCDRLQKLRKMQAEESNIDDEPLLKAALAGGDDPTDAEIAAYIAAGKAMNNPHRSN